VDGGHGDGGRGLARGRAGPDARDRRAPLGDGHGGARQRSCPPGGAATGHGRSRTRPRAGPPRGLPGGGRRPGPQGPFGPAGFASVGSGTGAVAAAPYPAQPRKAITREERPAFAARGRRSVSCRFPHGETSSRTGARRASPPRRRPDRRRRGSPGPPRGPAELSRRSEPVPGSRWHRQGPCGSARQTEHLIHAITPAWLACLRHRQGLALGGEGSECRGSRAAPPPPGTSSPPGGRWLSLARHLPWGELVASAFDRLRDLPTAGADLSHCVPTRFPATGAVGLGVPDATAGRCACPSSGPEYPNGSPSGVRRRAVAKYRGCTHRIGSWLAGTQ
jgi:hypothetical protein